MTKTKLKRGGVVSLKESLHVLPGVQEEAQRAPTATHTAQRLTTEISITASPAGAVLITIPPIVETNNNTTSLIRVLRRSNYSTNYAVQPHLQSRLFGVTPPHPTNTISQPRSHTGSVIPNTLFKLPILRESRIVGGSGVGGGEEPKEVH